VTILQLDDAMAVDPNDSCAAHRGLYIDMLVAMKEQAGFVLVQVGQEAVKPEVNAIVFIVHGPG
jgi:hypothetical protein